MAIQIKNKKGFKVIQLSFDELLKLGWGNLCMYCNNEITNEIYYIAVLNDLMCKTCYEKWINQATRYYEDLEIEKSNFNKIWNML